MIAKVVSTSFKVERQLRINSSVTFPDHKQDIQTDNDELNLIKDLIKFENFYDSGLPTDLIIVNKGEYAEGQEYLNSINGMKTRNGCVRVIFKPNNIGWSFGDFNYAFNILKDEYKYFIFTEDDIFIGGDKYAKNMVERYEKDELGYLALLGIMFHPLGTHCGGGIGMASSEVLTKVCAFNRGILPHYTKENELKIPTLNFRDLIIKHGEVDFTNIYLQTGMKIAEYGPCKSWNLEENYCFPYFNLRDEIRKS